MCKTFSNTWLVNDLITFSFRLPRDLAADIEAAAKQMGINRSDYARRALEHFRDHAMQQQMADLSRQLALQTVELARAMEASESDGLA